MFKKILLILAGLSLYGCSVTYLAEPANEISSYNEEICVIEHPDVRTEFIKAYESQLVSRGFSVKILPKDTSLSACKITSTYIGKWSWDFVPYMATAKISVFQEGILVGEATYAAPRAGWSMTTKIYENTEVKISGMLDKLFPNP